MEKKLFDEFVFEKKIWKFEEAVVLVVEVVAAAVAEVTTAAVSECWCWVLFYLKTKKKFFF